MNAHGVDRERFPIVVDSDAAKAGTYVPGTGQPIRFREWLVSNPVDVIVIPCQWRAADIVSEIHQHGISYETILLSHGGELVDFQRGDHPYRRLESTRWSSASGHEGGAAGAASVTALAAALDRSETGNSSFVEPRR
jgi:hypothetical protein